MATKAIPIKMCRGAGSSILNCIGTVKENEFYDSWNVLEGNKVCYCNKCCDKILKYYKNNGCDDMSAFYYTLQKIDIPFIEEVYKSLLDKNKLSIKTYIGEVQSRKERKDAWNDFTASDKIEHSAKDTEEQNKKLDELEEIWGIQDMEKDYEFLENTFNRYTKGIEFTNPQQKDLYRDLCRDRLLLRKINDCRYSGEETIDKVQNRIGKTMATLKVDQFEKKKEKTDIEKLLEYRIWEIENTEPAEVVDKNEYADYLGIENTWYQHILRSVRNLLVGSKEYPNITKEGMD